MNLSIVADENIAGASSCFNEFGTVRTISGRQLRNSDLTDVDVLLVRSITPVNENLLAGTAVKFVGTATSGFDHVDRAYLTERGISFAHAPGANANSVVEYVLGAVASVDDKLECLFNGGSIGVIGYGNIGKLLATRLVALGLSCKVYDPWLEHKNIPGRASLAEVLQCEVISVHAELTRKNPWPSFHLLGEAELFGMQEGALLINASRGPVVDNSALQHYLEKKHGANVVLDVWEDEPRVSEKLLSRVRFGTAHIAGYSMDGKLLATSMLKEALLQYLNLPVPRGRKNRSGDVISLVEAHSGAELLRMLLRHHYDISEDDQMLRAAIRGQSSDAAAAAFDSLRKKYRSRRELFGSLVDVPLKDPVNLRIIDAMGCQLA